MDLKTAMLENHSNVNHFHDSLTPKNFTSHISSLSTKEAFQLQILKTSKTLRIQADLKLKASTALQNRIKAQTLKSKLLTLKTHQTHQIALQIAQKKHHLDLLDLEKKKILQEQSKIDQNPDPLLSLRSGGTLYAAMPPGNIIGEMSLENAAPRNATGVALDDLNLLVITKKDYNELFADILMIERKFKID